MSDDERNELFSKCQAFINPQKEDFGITIVEAMASGRPVIALGQGGATETVIPGLTGELFDEETCEDIKKTVEKFNSSDYDPAKIREHAMKFSKKNFKKNIREFIDKKLGNKREAL